MTTTPTDPTVEMFIGSSWVDVTPDCREASADSGGGMEITRGTPNEGNSPEPTQFNFTLQNGPSKVPAVLGRTGCYSPRNPLGPYYGLLGRNQKIRVSLNRRVDTFNRTTVQGWGSVPTKVQADGVTVAPAMAWHITGAASDFSTTPGNAVMAATAGTKFATFGYYADAEMRTRFKVSSRDTEVGITVRMKKTFIEPPSGMDPTFETGGTAGWGTNSGTISINSVLPHAGARALQVVVTGAPATVQLVPDIGAGTLWGGGNLVGGGTYRCRFWVRVTSALTVQGQISFYGRDLSFKGSVTTSVAVAANTWTLVDFTGTAPEDAAWARPGPILQGSPAAGTVMILDDLEMYDQTNLAWYTANFVPGGTDQIKFGKISPGVVKSFSTDLGQQLVAGTWYWMKVQTSGQRLRMAMWKDGDPEPEFVWRWFDDETVSESPVGTVGEIGVFAGAGTGVATFSSFQVDQWRAHTEIAELPPRWDLSRSDRWVPIQSRGILRRLGQGRKALRSALSLHLESYKALSYGWWSLEESSGDRAGNNVAGGTLGSLLGLEFGEPDLSGSFAMPGVAGFATLSTDTAYFIGNVLPHANTTGKESFLFFFRLPQTPASQVTVATINSTGTARTWIISITSTNGLRVRCTDRSGVTLADQEFALYGGMPIGSWISAVLYLNQNGGNVDYALNYHRPGSTDFWTNNGSYAGTVGTFTAIRFQSTAAHTAAGSLSITQVMHYAGDLPFVTIDFEQAAYAYIGELSTLRFLRLCRNAGIENATTGLSSVGTPMGAQRPGKLIELLEDCATVEHGIVIEERGGFGFTIRTRDSMWNGIKHRLDIDLGHLSAPLDPNDDDQTTRNDVTVTRTNGGFARSIQITGPMNVNPPEDDPDGVGVYDESPVINFATDTQPVSAADWRRSKGTQDEARYPSIHADLAAIAFQNNPVLVAEVLSLDSGDIIDLLNPEVSPDPTEQIVQQYVEKLGIFDHDITWVTSPASVHRVGVVNYSTRVDSISNQVTSPFVSGTGTKLSTSLVAAGEPFVTIPQSEASFPFDIMASGVRLKVIATGDQLVFNGDFDTDIAGWVPSSANVSLAHERAVVKRGAGSMRCLAVAAGTDGPVQDPANSSVVTAATDYHLSGWIRTELAATDARIAVDWYQADNTTFISTSLPTPIVTIAGTWTWYSALVTSPALAARGRTKGRNVFGAAGRMWVDSLRLIPVSSYSGVPQTLTVQQAPVNGVVKTIPAGAVIRVAEPWRPAW